MKIYLDLDGVLANFNKTYIHMFGEYPAEEKHRHKHFWNNWEQFVNAKGFERLELMPDAHLILDCVEVLDRPTEILSSSGGHSFHDNVTNQKLTWLKKHEIDYKPNIVAGSSKKAQFVTSCWDILVDDTKKNVDQWNDAGGTGILHKNAHDTIVQLYDLHLEWQGGE